MKKLSITTRLNLILAVTFFTVLTLGMIVIQKTLEKKALDDIKQTAYLQMDMAQAVRNYTNTIVKPNIDNSKTFHSFTVPSFAANTTMQYLSAANPNYKYKEVAINPTNPLNRANEWQQELIMHFDKSQSGNQEIFKITGDGEAAVMNFIKPLRVTQSSCLNCHGNVSQAPIALVNKYGQNNGFNWKLGQVIGVQIVTVPTKVALKNAKSSLISYFILSILICIILFTVLNLMLSQLILNPIKTSNDKLSKISKQDFLTGALNRRAFDENLKYLIELKKNFSLIYIDIDHFKKVNDTFGHAVGDVVLKEFSKRIISLTANKYNLFRIGGEEFCVVLSGKEIDLDFVVNDLAVNIKQAITEKEFTQVGSVTASFGIACFRNNDNLNDVLRRADEALYKAKTKGRNRIEYAAEPLNKLKQSA